MKKKPELIKRTGRSSLALRNFLNNLKENDLHYENKQITQCVFLGVLRLKPVPSIFTSNNVPSVSATDASTTVNSEVKTTSNGTKKIKNVPKNNDINKILNGKITKRNPQKVKAAVKKVPVKKSNIIKIKLNAKKKVIKDKNVMSTSNNTQETLELLPDTSTSITPHTFLSAPTLSLTPIVSPTKFNPVQNLFDKLKQKIDDSNNEPGPSKITKHVGKPRDILQINAAPSKVCKINAKRTVKVAPIRKPKQSEPKKSRIYDRLMMPVKTPSPITISDTESTGKKDEDEITVITDESSSSSSFSQETLEDTEIKDITTEDVIFVNQEPKLNKSRTSPRNRISHNAEITGKQPVIITSEASRTTKAKNYSPKSNKTGQKLNEIIFIPDEPMVNQKHPERNKQSKTNVLEEHISSNDEDNSGSDVIIIDEVKEIRGSPRLKKTEESQDKSDKHYLQAENDVIEITEKATDGLLQNRSKTCSNQTKTQIATASANNEQNIKSKTKTLLKTIEKSNKTSVTIKRELIGSNNDVEVVTVVSEKPKQRKNRLKSPLLPPVLLTPMLLRSELAPKKTNTTQEKFKITNPRLKSNSRQLRSNIEKSQLHEGTSRKGNLQNKKVTKTNVQPSARLLRSELNQPKDTQPFLSSKSPHLLNDNLVSTSKEIILIPERESISKSQENPPEQVVTDVTLNQNVEKHSERAKQDVLQKETIENVTAESVISKEVDSEQGIIIISDEPKEVEVKTKEKSNMSSKIDINIHRYEDVKIIKEEQKINDTVLPRLLRSDVTKQKNSGNSSGNSNDIAHVAAVKNEREILSQARECLKDEHNRESKGSEQKIKLSNKQYDKKPDEDVVLIKEEAATQENASPRCLRSEINQQRKRSTPKKNNTQAEEEILIINEDSAPASKEKVSPRLLRSEVNQQNKSTQKIEQINLDEIVVVNEKRVKKPRERSNGRLLRSELAQQRAKEMSAAQAEVEKVVVLIHDEPKTKTKPLSALPKEEIEQAPSESSGSSMEEEVVVVEENLKKSEQSSPKSLQSSDKEIEDNTGDLILEGTRIAKHTSSPRLLRSEIVSQSASIVHCNSSDTSPDMIAGNRPSTSRLLRSDTITTGDKQNLSPRSLRSESASPEKSPRQTDKHSSSPRTLRSEIKSPRRIRDLSKEPCETIEILEEEKTEPSTSSRLLRSEVSQQSKTLNVPKKQSDTPGVADNAKDERQRLPRSETSLKSNEELESNDVIFVKTKEKPLYRRGRSLLMDLKLKQKTSMLLRSELAQIQKNTTDSMSVEREQNKAENKVEENKAPVVNVPQEENVTVLTEGKVTFKRKSLFDDLKRKKTAKEASLQHTFQKDQRTEPGPAENPVCLPKISSDHDVQVLDEKVVGATTEVNSAKIKRSRNVVPSKTTRKDTNTANTSESETNSKTFQNLPESNTISSEEIQLQNSEKLPTKEGNKSVQRKSKELAQDNQDNKAEEAPPQSKDSHLSSEKVEADADVSKSTPRKQRSSSSKKKLKESEASKTPEHITEDNQEYKAEEVPPQSKESQASSEKVDANADINKNTPRKQRSSPSKKKLKESEASKQDNPETKVEEPPQHKYSQMPSEEVDTDVGRNTPRKQRSPPSKKKLKDSEANKTPEHIVKDNIQSEELKLEANIISHRQESVSPKRKKLKESKPAEGAAEKPKEKTESSSVSEIEEIPPPKQKTSPKRKKTKDVDEENNVLDVSTMPSDEVKSEPTDQLSKQKGKPSSTKVTYKVKSKVGKKVLKTKKSAENPVHLEEAEPTLDKNTLQQNKKMAGKKKLKATETDEVNVAKGLIKVDNSVDNTSLLSSEAVKPKTGVKKRKTTPKNYSKGPKSEEKSTENLPEAESLADSTIPSVAESISDANDTKPPKKKKAVSSKRKLKPAKNKQDTPVEKPPEVDNVPAIDNPKKADITVFDFDETEPEVVPLRLSSTPKKDRITRPTLGETDTSDTTPNAKRQKLSLNKNSNDNTKTKAQAKAKLFDDKPTETSNNETSDCQPLSQPSNPLNDGDRSNKSSSPIKSNTSPLKQATITDMFNKVQVKKDRAAAVEAIFGPKDPAKEAASEGDTTTDMPPPKPLPPARDEGEENEYYEDDDSDDESRMEWIPEEYAEYKFKYSAKKMMSYKPIHKCKICLLILPSYYRLSKHKLEHAKKENPYNCTQCEQAFPSIDDLTAHLRLHKGKHPYTCKKCDIGFWSKKSLDAHTPIHVLRKVKQPNKRFRCDVCSKEFSKLCDMERHTRVHTGEKPCVCNICNKRFQQSHNLSKHLLTHLHVKPYHCEICNKQFGRNDVLNRHLLTHSVDKPIKCMHCQKGFIRQSQLNNHMKKNHLDAVKGEAKGDSKAIEAKN